MAVDDVFRSVFGERLALFILTCLEVKFLVGRLDIARKPEVFSKSLENLLGSVAAKNLERRVLRRLCQMMRVELELKEDVKFSDCICKLKNIYMQILAAKYKPLIMKR